MAILDVDKPLRRDVHFLGKLLGEVLSEQGGPELLELEEKVRRLAISRRRGPKQERAQASAELARLLRTLPEEKIEPVIRAFSTYFQLVNIAEQHHRIRRTRSYQSSAASPPQRGSIAATMLAARHAGVDAARMREALAQLEVTLTFTAHPTQAARRTVLAKLYRIARRLEERDRSRMTLPEKARAQEEMREEVTTLWQTEEVRHERPTVGDEVKNVLWYVEEILWDVLPGVSESIEAAFERAYGEKLGRMVTPLRLHSWVGGDMDGNPFVTPDVLEDAIRAHEIRGLRRLLADVKELGESLSQSTRYVEAPKTLQDSLAADQRLMPDIAAHQGPRTEGEPWRRKLAFIEARLEATLLQAESRRSASRLPDGTLAHGGFSGGLPLYPAAYRHPAELERDLELVAETLREAGGPRAGERRVRAVGARVRALGFHIVELEMRAPAEEVREAAAFLAGRASGPGTGARVLDALRRISRAQQEGGEQSCRTLILSMAHSADDVLAALACARESGLWEPHRPCARLDVVPLFETLQALNDAPKILRELFADPIYRAHVACRGVQEVMVGYSDSGKEVGLLAATGALRRAQEALPKIAAEAGVPLRIFHGRGESVARGGGPAHQAILALPRGAVDGRYKATEQGEALDQKYARPELALRTVELVLGGALIHTLGVQPQVEVTDEARYSAAYDELAEIGRQTYRALVWEHPRFVEYFSSATPIDEIARLPIGSRPSKRRAGGVEALRAIPWVFAWTQNRGIVPGWYGVGTALEAFAQREGGQALLEEMYQRWPFFRAVMDNVEMVLAKSDLDISSRYARLASKEAREEIWPLIKGEFLRTRRWVRRLAGHRRLLDSNRQLRRSIALRNPYVDPMSFLQVELLKRKRSGDDTCDRALLLTLNGIAAGMRNTG